MKKEVWQTTNQQPWVEALACGAITCKTRTSKPVVPLGATVLLHASKSRLWSDWKGLKTLLNKLPNKNPESWDRGVISAIAVVKEVGVSHMVMSMNEAKNWDVHFDYSDTHCYEYNSVADYTIRFTDIKRLKNPVAVRGFQAPFAHATDSTIEKVLKANPELKSYFE